MDKKTAKEIIERLSYGYVQNDIDYCFYLNKRCTQQLCDNLCKIDIDNLPMLIDTINMFYIKNAHYCNYEKMPNFDSVDTSNEQLIIKTIGAYRGKINLSSNNVKTELKYNFDRYGTYLNIMKYWNNPYGQEMDSVLMEVEGILGEGSVSTSYSIGEQFCDMYRLYHEAKQKIEQRVDPQKRQDTFMEKQPIIANLVINEDDKNNYIQHIEQCVEEVTSYQSSTPRE